MNVNTISTPSSSTSAEPQATPSNRDEQLERLQDLQQLIDNLLDAAGEVSRLAQEIADEDKDQGDVYDAAQNLIREVEAIEEWRELRYLTAAIKDEATFSTRATRAATRTTKPLPSPIQASLARAALSHF
jgi:hypothetical protein